MKALLSKISLFLLLTLSTMFTMQTVILTKAYEKIDEVSYNYDDITISDLILNDEEVKLANEYIRLQIDDGNIGIIPRSLAVLAGTFFIPGVGQAVITTAGVIIVGGAIVSAGSWLGQKVISWVENYKEINTIKNSIPNNLKKGNGDVDLGQFKDKNGRTPLNKNSGTFKNGRWSVEKDNTGHGGRKWKLKRDGERVASLDEDGKILSK